MAGDETVQGADGRLAADDSYQGRHSAVAQETLDYPIRTDRQADAVQRVSARERLLTVVSFAVAGVVLFVLYYGKARTIGLSPDGASTVLQAWDMLHGNVLLSGWSLSHVSFYTFELPEYVLVEAVRGAGANVVATSAALTYTLAVLFAALLARGNATGRTGLIRALIGGGIMLAPVWTGLLSNPNHLGTQIPLMLIWLLIDRCRPRWWMPVLVAALLAWSQVADTLTVYEGVLPLMAVCVARIYRRGLRLSAGSDEERYGEAGASTQASFADWYGLIRPNWYEAALAVAAVAGALASVVTLHLIRVAGGFAVLQPKAFFGSVDQIASRIGTTAESILTLYSADFSGHTLRASVDALIHLAGLALAVWALSRAYRRFWGQDLVTQLLAVAAGVLVVTYTLTGNPDVGGGTHEINGLLPIGAVLAGRLLGPSLARLRLFPVLAVVLVLYTGVLVHQAVRHPKPAADARIGAWLSEHHLDQGLATYWDANIMTVTTSQQVRLTPVSQKSGRLVIMPWDSAASWYNPKTNHPTFYLLNTRYAACPDPARTQARWQNRVTAAFGPPAKVYRNVYGYDVLVWDRNLLNAHIPQVAPHAPPACL